MIALPARRGRGGRQGPPRRRRHHRVREEASSRSTPRSTTPRSPASRSRATWRCGSTGATSPTSRSRWAACTPTTRRRPNFPKLHRLTLQFGDGDNPRLGCRRLPGDHRELVPVRRAPRRARRGGRLRGRRRPRLRRAVHLRARVLDGRDDDRRRRSSCKGKTGADGGAARLQAHRPAPVARRRGRQSAHVLFFDVSVPFDKRGATRRRSLAELDAKKPVLDALGDTRNWSASLPTARTSVR